MNYSFVNRPAVKADLISAVSYYKKISPELAQKFLDRVKEAKNHIALSPEGFQVRYKNVRIKTLEQFPFNIHYLIDNQKQQIVILAIVHGYKKPEQYK
jgi:plasmid stabilization system protein ParE